MYLKGSFRALSHFYPRSPCGERLKWLGYSELGIQFLSTLSLRRATVFFTFSTSCTRYFYPRSPCGERRVYLAQCGAYCVISIHALLAESDATIRQRWATDRPFLSTLSLRRATLFCLSFFPKSIISIHALLAESDGTNTTLYITVMAFLSTLSLRRATINAK